MLYFTRWKAAAIIGAVVLGILMALPNVLPPNVREAVPDFLPSSPVTLGLDLSGGSHVLLEVDRADLEDQLSRQLIGDIRQTLRDERIRYSGLGRQDGHRAREQLATAAGRRVRAGEHGEHLVPGCQEGLQRGDGDLGGAGEEQAHRYVTEPASGTPCR